MSENSIMWLMKGRGVFGMVFVGVLLSVLFAVPSRCCFGFSSGVSPEPAVLKQIDKLVEQYGKQPFISMIRARRHGKISIEVNHRIRAAIGPPNKKYVTARSIAHDMELMHLGVEALPEALNPYLKEQRTTGMKITSRDIKPLKAGVAGDSGEEVHFSPGTYGPADRDAYVRFAREMIGQEIERLYPGERFYVDFHTTLKSEIRKDSRIYGFLGLQGPCRVRSVRLEADTP